MKKILLAGALAASMLTSSAFASVLTVKYDKADNLVYVTDGIDMTKYAGDQMTVVVVSGDGDEVTTNTIRYIDQDMAEAGLFETMGVLLKDGETELPAGSYTVKIGGENVQPLYEGSFTVEEDAPVGKTVKFVFGDVDGSYNAETMSNSPIDAVGAVDASVILGLSAGLDVAAGGAYSIGTLVEVAE